jgi:hypothetical protein
MPDLTHLQGRVVTAGGDVDGGEHDGWGGPPIPAHVRTWHRLWAAEYLRRVESGDAGAAFNYLHDLRYGTPAAYVDPWRLVHLVAARAIEARSGGGDPGPGAGAAGVEPDQAAVVAATREDGEGNGH